MSSPTLFRSPRWWGGQGPNGDFGADAPQAEPAWLRPSPCPSSCAAPCGAPASITAVGSALRPSAPREIWPSTGGEAVGALSTPATWSGQGGGVPIALQVWSTSV